MGRFELGSFCVRILLILRMLLFVSCLSLLVLDDYIFSHDNFNKFEAFLAKLFLLLMERTVKEQKF